MILCSQSLGKLYPAKLDAFGILDEHLRIGCLTRTHVGQLERLLHPLSCGAFPIPILEGQLKVIQGTRATLQQPTEGILEQSPSDGILFLPHRTEKGKVL